MRNTSTLLLLIIIQIQCFSQKTLTSDSDTCSYFREHYYQFLDQLNIPKLQDLEADFAFRFWDGRKFIQLIEKDNKLEGTLFFVLQEYATVDDERYYQSQQILDSTQAIQIKNLVLDLGIHNIPTEDQIEGWRNGFDGYTYLLETVDFDSYSIKSYWSPEIFHELKEARLLVYFMNELNLMDVVIESNKKFMKHQPFKSYYVHIGGITIATVLRRW